MLPGKKLVTFLYILVFAGIAYVLLVLKNILPSPELLFTPKKVQIITGPSIIKEIRSLGELMTKVCYDEVIVDFTQQSEGNIIEKTFSSPSKLVLIVHGKTYCGIDLRNIDEQSILVNDSSITIKIPPAQIIDVVMNPSDVETFVEKGEWSLGARQALLDKAKTQLTARAVSKGIIQDSQLAAEMVLTNFFKSLGYLQVNIVVR